MCAAKRLGSEALFVKFVMAFPSTRLRRLRQNPLIRERLEETTFSPHRLIAPFFVRPGKNERRPIHSMPGQYQFSIDLLIKEIDALIRQGVATVLLFGIPPKKDAKGSDAYASDGIVQQAVRAL